MVKKYKSKIFSKTKNFSNYYIFILFLLTFLIIFLTKIDSVIVKKIKSTGITTILPISQVINIPVNLYTETLQKIIYYRSLDFENKKLKEEIIRLKEWQQLAIKYERENKNYKTLLNSTKLDVNHVKTTQVISRSPTFYKQSILINAGQNDQVKKNQIVRDAHGLVGRIIEVNNTFSKALLINDKNSNVSVKSLNNNFYAIVSGSSKGSYLESKYIKNNKQPIIGDILVTSGMADTFPKDIPVGQIINIKDNKAIIIPFVNFNNLELLQIVKIN